MSALLVASSNLAFRARLLKVLRPLDRVLYEACGGADALAKLDDGSCRCTAALLDRRLSDLAIDDVIQAIAARYPNIGVFVMDSQTGEAEMINTAHASADALRVLEFVREHCTSASSEALVETMASPAPETWRRESLPHELPVPLPGMIGSSAGMARVYTLARLVSSRDTAVLITGETGTGKELVARAIHALGARARRPFIVVNCAAIPETLLEAELFGYTRGAFTGAFQNHLGRIHSAHGGAVFLDEVSELPGAMQAKLLRFLQEGEVQRLGSPDVFRVDVRVIAATNARLARKVNDGTFRQDLYYRLAVFPIDIPPLRDRREEILPLAQLTLHSLCSEAHIPVKTLAPAAIRLLEQFKWPGNVRELQHAIERAFILATDAPVLLTDHFALLEDSN